MPDISSSVYCSIFLVVRARLDAVDDFLSCNNLIGSHHEKLSIDGKDAIFG